MHTTRPADLYVDMERRPGISPVQIIQHWLKYAKYGVGGALGALALAQTAGQVFRFEPTDVSMLVAAICGGVAMLLAARAVKLL